MPSFFLSNLNLEPATESVIITHLENADIPLKIRNSISELAMRDWSCSTLKNIVGDYSVILSSIKGAVFDYSNSGEPSFTDETLLFTEAINRVQKSEIAGTIYYLRQVPLSTLGINFNVSSITALLPVKKNILSNLWIGSVGCATPLHYDEMNNLITVTQGYKRVILVPPSEFKELHPFGFGYRRGHICRINPEVIDTNTFPDFPIEKICEVILEAGDSLFIPAFWWHYIRSFNMCVSINSWWSIRIEQTIVPATVDYLRSSYLNGKLERLLKESTKTPIIRALKVAELGMTQNLVIAALLFTGLATKLTVQCLKQRYNLHNEINWIYSDNPSVLANNSILPRKVIEQFDSLFTIARTVALTGSVPSNIDPREIVNNTNSLISQYISFD